MDTDLDQMSRADLVTEVDKLRAAIRVHRDSSRHELCWHHPAMWSLLPDQTDPRPVVPEWPQFMQGCIAYRSSLDEQARLAPRTDDSYDRDLVPRRSMTEDAPPLAGLSALVIDCTDPPALARWWSRLAGGRVDVDVDGDAALRLPGGLVLDFLRVLETKQGKNRLHIDLRAGDLEAATEHALRLGANLANDIYSGGDFKVLRDPEGNEFCLLGPVE